MNDVAVSVIVPVYNSLSTINRCVFSLVSQSLTEFEIILINDCSTDETPAILEEWKKQCPDRIAVYSTDRNRGAGGARNLGIEKAHGRYIGFVDSDDYVESSMYEKMYRKALESDADVIDAGFYVESDDKAILYTTDACVSDLSDENRAYLISCGGYIWNKLYKRELFNDPNYRMRENCNLEDADFLVYLFSHIKSIATVKEPLYFYSDTVGSLSKEAHPGRNHNHIVKAIGAIGEKCKLLGEDLAVVEAAEYEIVQLYTYGVINAVNDYLGPKDIDAQKAEEELKEMLISSLPRTVENAFSNRFVKERIDAHDLEFARLNLKSPTELLKRVFSK